MGRNRYGGIYRLPPRPQRVKPSSSLPSEVFPNPPVGQLGRIATMALVAASWVYVPTPLPAHVTRVTIPPSEARAHVPREQHPRHLRVILEAWKYTPQAPVSPVRAATLPAEVFPSPIPRQDKEYLKVILSAWKYTPQAPASPVRAATLPVQIFDDPPKNIRERSQYLAIVRNSWIPARQFEQKLPTTDPPIVGILTITIAGDAWQNPLTTAMKQAIIDGLSAATTQSTGWNNEVRDKMPVSVVGRISDQIVTVHVPLASALDIDFTETITSIIPASVLVANVNDVVAIPTFDIIAEVPPSVNNRYLRVIGQAWQPKVIVIRSLPRVIPETAVGPGDEPIRGDHPHRQIINHLRWLKHYKIIPQVTSAAALPAQVFPDPPVEDRARQTVNRSIWEHWRYRPVPQRQYPQITETGAAPSVFVPRGDDPHKQIVTYRRWLKDYRLPPRTTAALLPSVDPDPVPGLSRLNSQNILREQWKYIAPPQRHYPTATLPAAAFDDPPGNLQKQHLSVVLASWKPIFVLPQTVRHAPPVRKVPYAPYRVSTNYRQHLGHVLYQKPIRNATLPAQVFDNPPVETRRNNTNQRIIAETWIWVPEPQRLHPTAILPTAVFDDPSPGYQQRIVLNTIVRNWYFPPKPPRGRIFVTVSGLLWTKIDDSQVPGWIEVDDSQTPAWSEIDDSQVPGWTEIQD